MDRGLLTHERKLVKSSVVFMVLRSFHELEFGAFQIVVANGEVDEWECSLTNQREGSSW